MRAGIWRTRRAGGVPAWFRQCATIVCDPRQPTVARKAANSRGRRLSVGFVKSIRLWNGLASEKEVIMREIGRQREGRLLLKVVMGYYFSEKEGAIGDSIDTAAERFFLVGKDAITGRIGAGVSPRRERRTSNLIRERHPDIGPTQDDPFQRCHSHKAASTSSDPTTAPITSRSEITILSRLGRSPSKRNKTRR
jgi:hypothetical protein